MASNLKVFLTADTTKFQKSLKKARWKLKKFSRAAKQMAVAGGAAFVGLGIAVKKAMGDLDRIGKGAKQLGVSTDAFQKLSFAAERSGASMSNVEAGMKRMTRVVNDAGNGLESAKRPLRQIGLSFEDLQGLSVEDQFKKIAGALSNVKDESQKTALAQELFGRSGVSLKVMLKDYNALSKEADKLGIVIAEKNIKAAEKFEDAWTNITASMKARLMNSGFIEWASNALQTVSKWLAENGTQWINTFKFMWIEAQASIAKIIAVFQVALDNYGKGFQWISDNWNNLWSNALNIGIAVLKDYLNVYTNFWKSLYDVAVQSWDLIKALLTGGDVGAAFNALFEKAVAGFANTVANVGKETEKAMNKAGVTKLNLGGLDAIKKQWAVIDQEKKARQDALLKKAQDATNKVGETVKKQTGEANKKTTASKTATKHAFAGAVEQGTVEAYRAEITKNNKGPENETAKNTKQQVVLQKKTIDELSKIGMKIATGGATPTYAIG